MRSVIVAFAVSALIAGAGCGRPPHPALPTHPGEPGVQSRESRDIVANSVFGSVDVRETTDLCAGRVRLAQGAATVNDACFTGDTNVVLCTDASSANAVQCAAGSGKLALAGSGSDLINYARVR
jgi:hypothetical protein